MAAKPRTIRVKTPYIDAVLTLDPHHYHNGIPALQLWGQDEDGNPEPYATASVNPPVADPSIVKPGHIFLKGWSENEGIPEALISAGVVGPAVGSVRSGFVNITVHPINPEYLALWATKEAA